MQALRIVGDFPAIFAANDRAIGFCVDLGDGCIASLGEVKILATSVVVDYIVPGGIALPLPVSAVE